MEFCVNWNTPGSTCECDTCLGPWIETPNGYWKHAFDQLQYTYIKPLRNVIPLEVYDSDNDQDGGYGSPVSSISDQYSTDATYSPGIDLLATPGSSPYSSRPSSDGILTTRNEVNEPSDSESVIISSDEGDMEEIVANQPGRLGWIDPLPIEEPHQDATVPNDYGLILDFPERDQMELDRIFDEVFAPDPPNIENLRRPNTPRPEVNCERARPRQEPINFFEYPPIRSQD